MESRVFDPYEVLSEFEVDSEEAQVAPPESEPPPPAEVVSKASDGASYERARGRVDLDEIVDYIFEDATDQIHSLRVVELGATNIHQGIIAAKSSLGVVILGSREGDTFEMQTDGKVRLVRIVTIYDIEDGEALTSRPINIPHNISLTPYTAWESRPLPDPRSAKPSEILVGLEEIVDAEGPISCERAFSLYAKAAGLQRLGADIKDSLYKALQSGINKGRLNSVNELRLKDRLKNILTIPGKAQRLPRESGGRDFGDIPPNELRVLLDQVIASNGGGGDRNTIYREVVFLMGGNRLATSARRYLARVEEIMP